MSKRFGRNQRRRAREAIAALQFDIEKQGVILALKQKKMLQLQQELDDAKAIAGPMSILFPVETEFHPGFPSTPERPLSIGVPGRLPDSFISDEATGPMEELRYSSLTLETLILNIRPAVLDGCIHVNVQFGDGVWRYGLTRAAWYALPRERRQRLIAESIPQELAREVAKHGFR